MCLMRHSSTATVPGIANTATVPGIANTAAVPGVANTATGEARSLHDVSEWETSELSFLDLSSYFFSFKLCISTTP